MTPATGATYAVMAYAAWGFFPAYWKLLAHVDAWEVAAYRMVGSALTYVLILAWKDRQAFFRGSRSALRNHFNALLLSSFLISVNWLLYVWAVNAGRVVETSLGYFITPLINVALGACILGERLTLKKWIAVGTAALGVLVLTVFTGQLPWISLVLAATFGLYGLVRKRLILDPLWASALEALLLSPFAAFALMRYGHAVSYSGADLFFLALGGPVTAFPLLWFAEAARRLPLSTLGFFQYIAPTIQFLLGIFVYQEAFTPAKFAGFILVWSALVIYLVPMGIKKTRG